MGRSAAPTILPPKRGVQLTILDLDLSDVQRALLGDWLNARLDPPDLNQAAWTAEQHAARARELMAKAEESYLRAQDHERAAKDARRTLNGRGSARAGARAGERRAGGE